MSRLLELEGVPVFFCRVDSADSRRIRVEDSGAPETQNLPSFDVQRDLTAFASLLRRIGVMHVHVHHLADFPASIQDFLRIACLTAGLAYDITVHDYMAICPRVTLTDRTELYCGEPDIESCETCVARDGSPFGHPSVWEWRERYACLYAGARKVFVPDSDVARRLRRFMPAITPIVRPHPEPDFSSNGTKTGEQAVLPRITARGQRTHRAAVLGAIGSHKGSRLLLATARAARSRQLPLEFIVIGYTDMDHDLLDVGNVVITGRYEEGDAEALLSASDADFAWFPAVWPETYSYTLSVTFKAGIFPVAFDLGAIASRIREVGFGELLPLELMLDPFALASHLVELPSREKREGSFQPKSYDSPLLSSYYALAASR